jgi:hypothetical protein
MLRFVFMTIIGVFLGCLISTTVPRPAEYDMFSLFDEKYSIPTRVKSANDDCAKLTLQLHEEIDSLVLDNDRISKSFEDLSRNFTLLQEELRMVLKLESEKYSASELVVFFGIILVILTCVYLAILTATGTFRLMRRSFNRCLSAIGLELIDRRRAGDPIPLETFGSVSSSNSVNYGTYRPEGFVESSPYRDALAPSSQCSINVRVGQALSTIGQATWIGQHLTTAEHVITAASRMGDEVILEREGNMVTVRCDSFSVINGVDVAVMEFNQKDSTKLKMSKAKIAGLSYMKGMVVSTFAKGFMTTGWAEKHPTDCGKILYKGSTKEGFSGAAYYWTDKVVALHIGSVKYGIAYDINFVLALLKQQQQFTLESGTIDDGTSGEIIRNLLQKNMRMGKQTRYHQVDPERVMVDVGDDRYMTFDIDDLPNNFFNHNVAPSNLIRTECSDLASVLASSDWSHQDKPSAASLTKNSQRPSMMAETVKTVKEIIVQESGKVDRVGNAQPQNGTKPKSLKKTSVKKSVKSSMPGPALIPVQQSEVLPCTSKSSNNHEEILRMSAEFKKLQSQLQRLLESQSS